MLAAIFLVPTLKNYNDTLLPENMRPSAAGPVLALLAALAAVALGLGAPQLVDEDKLTQEERKVVDFALVQLQGGEGCQQRLVKVENFSRQV